MTTDDYDYFVAETVDIRDGDTFGDLIDQQLINGIDGSFDTNLFNSDSLAMPVTISALQDAGIIGGSTAKLDYWVESYTGGAGFVDAIGSEDAPMTLSVASPGLASYGDFWSLLNTDLPGKSLQVRRDDASFASDKPIALMLMHHLNTDGLRSQVVRVKVTTSTKLAVNDSDFSYGFRPTLTATVSPAGATGTVTFKDGSKVLATVAVSGGKATYKAPVLARGTHTLTATYNGSTTHVGSTGSAKVVVR